MKPYYQHEHLHRFGEIGQNAPELAKKYFAWYNAVFEAGALSEREKGLIAVAVAHAVQCPYCIEAWTEGSMKAGADADQITEAIHVAAAIRGGASLVHGVMARDVIEAKGMG